MWISIKKFPVNSYEKYHKKIVCIWRDVTCFYIGKRIIQIKSKSFYPYYEIKKGTDDLHPWKFKMNVF